MSTTIETESLRSLASTILAAHDRLCVHRPDTLGHRIAVSAIAKALQPGQALTRALGDAAIELGLTRRELDTHQLLDVIAILLARARQRDLLVDAVNKAAKEAGMLRAEVLADGPQLLQIAGDMGAEVARLTSVTQIESPQYEAARDAVAEALGTAYDCARAWSAWSYGTMSQNDFSLVAEDGERLDEITRAALIGAGLSVPT